MAVVTNSIFFFKSISPKHLNMVSLKDYSTVSDTVHIHRNQIENVFLKTLHTDTVFQTYIVFMHRDKVNHGIF